MLFYGAVCKAARREQRCCRAPCSRRHQGKGRHVLPRLIRQHFHSGYGWPQRCGAAEKPALKLSIFIKSTSSKLGMLLAKAGRYKKIWKVSGEKRHRKNSILQSSQNKIHQDIISFQNSILNNLQGQ